MGKQLTTPGGLSVGYHEWGRPDGPVAVLLHGLTASGADWQIFGTGLGRRFRVIAPDARGHGATDWTEHYSIESMRDDVVDLMDGLGVLAAAVIGHSMGAVVAYLLAATHPDRVRALVLEDPPPPVPADPPREVPDGPQPGVDVDWRAVAQFLRWRNDPDPVWWSYADRIRCQSLVLSGELGHMPQAQQRRLAELIPRSTFRSLHVGHEIHADRPGEMLAVVEPFLAAAIR